jgi:dolichyl-phosphate beta-glucosyltransferase
LEDPASVDLTVVIPAYNETQRLPGMLESTMAHLASSDFKASGRTFEILIVDDGSTDDTFGAGLDLARQYKDASMKIVKLEKNLGKGGAVRHGMLHSSGKRLLMVDADGASRFSDIELLWKAIDNAQSKRKGEAVVAVGSRAHLVKSEAVVKVCVLCNF